MNIFQMMQSIRNPQDFMNQMIGNAQIMQNPMAKNALDMWQRGDEKGLEELARNMCKTNNINPDDALKKVKSMFGM